MEQQTLFNHWIKIIDKQLNVLPDKSEENADNTLRALWLTVSGTRISPVLASTIQLPELTVDQVANLESLIKKRLDGIPLAHLTGRQNFMGLDYILEKGIYIPRKETELLAKSAIDLLKEKFHPNEQVNVLDLCCGIGTVALAIAWYCKNSVAYGSDIYEPAIRFANTNVENFKLEQRASFFHGNLFDPFENIGIKGSTDIIVSAPPYISSAKVPQMAEEIANHEPREAFDAGPFGFFIFNKLISVSPDFLNSKGYLLIECGLGQGEFVAKRMNDNGNYSETIKICDELGNLRVLCAQKK